MLLRFIYLPFINYLLRPLARLRFHKSGKELMSISGNISFSTKGITFRLATNQTCFVTKYMFYNGFEAYEYNWLFKSLAQNATGFLDVGANIGLYSVLAAKYNPQLTIHAFEPGSGAVHFLRKNSTLNRLDAQINIHEIAMSNQDASLEFHEAAHPKFPWLKHNLNGSSSLQAEHGRSKSTAYKVAVCRLSSFLKEHEVSHFDLIKLDTEHTEQLIIADNQDIFAANRPLVMIEIYPEIAHEMQDLLKSWEHYHYLRLEQPFLNPIELQELGTHQKHVNYLLVPTEKISWIEQFLNDKK
ncbi:MAG: FkbM family methyltransferase [Flavobacteriales bacterium]